MTDQELVPKLETSRLLLRQVDESDFDNYKKYFVDYEVIKHLASQVPWPYPENGVAEFFKNIIYPELGKTRWNWGIYLKSNPGELIGAIDLLKDGKPEHRGFWLGKKFWGNGYMTEAVIPVMNYAFETLGYEKLILTNALGNIKSRRVKEKTGARFIGLKDQTFVSPEYTQSEIWEVTKPEWFKNNRPSFITHYKNIIEPDNAHYPGSNELLSIGSPVGKKCGLKNIGVHIETIPPGRRTSWPHAEKEEEEFAFVIEGNPEVWIDGYLYKLEPGDFVGLPAGTGIAHTFINNTKTNAILLVGGDANKSNNQVFYPLHPSRNQEIKNKNFLWENPPERSMGEHSGNPDSIMTDNIHSNR